MHEALFLHDYAFDKVIHDLPGGIPFLFPVCARLARNNQPGVYLLDHRQYKLKIHGFSWFTAWEVIKTTQHSIEMVLKENINTIQIYPFRFEIKLKYIVSNGKLSCYQIYKNTEQNKSMPYYAGFHPYFSTRHIPKEKIILNCDFKKRLKYNHDLTDIVGEQAVFAVPTDIANLEINEQLCILGKDKLATLTFPNGDILKTIADEKFSYMQLYHIPEKSFFCVERWMSFPNALNAVSGVHWLKPGESQSAVFEVFV